uniref:DUF4218 domain-containing protein n=1 Tax=Cajanus cajan TaxID=3821 RepID=A0A151R0B8_CAJCA|nr:hypothetical protein KK1_042873 [Cajanus cajan]
MPEYFIWTDHGEGVQNISRNVDDASSSGIHVTESETFNTMHEMLRDAVRQHGSFEIPETNFEEPPNEATRQFYNLLMESNEPLFEGSSESKLSICVRLLACKSNWNVLDQCVDFITKMLLDIAPMNTTLPKNYYDAKRLVSKLGLTARKIDCCRQGCMLFYDNEYGKNDGALACCKFCDMPRYRDRNIGANTNKLVPVKTMFYLPIIPRLQRLFASMQTAGHMCWHHEFKNSSGVLRHPSDGEAWKHFNRVHADFAVDPRNVRLGLCSDGFNPFYQSTIPYSCWPVILTPYNLPPEMCMTKPFMFLTCLIPGPRNPKAGIDVFLEPLVDDLKKLWTGVETYDISKKKNFNMRASLMWTINDFPAYGMLSGWGTQGKLACPHCMEYSKAFTLENGGKNCWFDSHRRFLPHDHTFRKNKKAFLKGKVETDGPPPTMTPDLVWGRVMDLPMATENPRLPKLRGYGEFHNWRKKSIFWNLPYWKDNLLRHNLDVMHIEKNFFDNILNTIMNVSGKTKDNEKARMDLTLYCSRPDLELKPLANGKMFKPKANYSLTIDEAKSVCRWIKELRVPDGYSSNLARCADVEKGRMHGMKSHDCHVFMECLLPIAFSTLPMHVLNPLIEISHFFKDLCSTTLRYDDLVKMEENIPLILCKLERVFPPAFFDSMEHLPIHLAYEARLGGPVQYRWMYPFERFMGNSKRSIKNKARVEGSICAAYIHRETTHFCSHYFKNYMLSSRSSRNEVGIESQSCLPSLSIFNQPSRPSGKPSNHWLTQREWDSAHVHVLINCTEVKPYLE